MCYRTGEEAVDIIAAIMYSGYYIVEARYRIVTNYTSSFEITLFMEPDYENMISYKVRLNARLLMVRASENTTNLVELHKTPVL